MDLIQKALAIVFSEKSLNLKQYNYYNNECLRSFPHTLPFKSYIYTVMTSGTEGLNKYNGTYTVGSEYNWSYQDVQVFKRQHVGFFFPVLMQAISRPVVLIMFQTVMW